MADKTIGELPSIPSVQDNSLIPVEQNSTACKMTGAQFRQWAEASASPYATAAQQSAAQAASSASEAATSAATAASVVQQAAAQAVSQAEQYASDAASSASTAATQATNAANSATQASNKATASAASADEAAAYARQAAAHTDLPITRGTSGTNSMVMGDIVNNQAIKAYAIAEGSQSAAIGEYSHAEGQGGSFSGLLTSTSDVKVYSITDTTGLYVGQYVYYKGALARITAINETDSPKTITLNRTLGRLNAEQCEIYGAMGESSHAEGNKTQASGDHSHAEGKETIASGSRSHTEGKQTKAFGDSSHAEGVSTTASGSNSHAEGSYTTASGSCSHAEGYRANASGSNSHAEGSNTTASGSCSHAEGYRANASGSNSHAEGTNTKASGSNSHAEGINTTANCKSQHVFGEYNVADPSGTATTRGTYVEIVGKGDSAAPANARTLEWNGNEWLAGKLTMEGTPTADKDAATKKYVDDAAAALVPLVGKGVNLLDNSYFIGGGGSGAFPVNQRAKTQYSEPGNCIDRWFLLYQGQYLNVLPNYISVYTTSSGPDFGQFVYNSRLPRYQPITFSVLTAEGVLGSITGEFNDSNAWIYGPIGDTGLVANFIYDWEHTGIRTPFFLQTGGVELHIAAMKLELGTTQTLARQVNGSWVLNDPPPNYQQELAKCQRYLQVITTNSDGALIGSGYVNSGTNNKQILITVCLPVTMDSITSLQTSNVGAMVDGGFPALVSASIFAKAGNIITLSLISSSSIATAFAPATAYIFNGGYIMLSAE